MIYKIIRPIIYIWFKLKYNPLIYNKDYIPKKGRVILAGNHTNNLDCLLLGYSTNRWIRYVAKDELLKGIKKIFFKSVGIIPVNRKIKDKSVIPTCVNLLNKDNIIGIFPEGTINRTKEDILPFKNGAVVMSNRSNSPIIPFAINGNYKKDKLKVIFGKMYYVQSDDIIKETKILEDKVIELIRKIDD